MLDLIGFWAINFLKEISLCQIDSRAVVFTVFLLQQVGNEVNAHLYRRNCQRQTKKPLARFHAHSFQFAAIFHILTSTCVFVYVKQFLCDLSTKCYWSWILSIKRKRISSISFIWMVFQCVQFVTRTAGLSKRSVTGTAIGFKDCTFSMCRASKRITKGMLNREICLRYQADVCRSVVSWTCASRKRVSRFRFLKKNLHANEKLALRRSPFISRKQIIHFFVFFCYVEKTVLHYVMSYLRTMFLLLTLHRITKRARNFPTIKNRWTESLLSVVTNKRNRLKNRPLSFNVDMRKTSGFFHVSCTLKFVQF